MDVTPQTLREVEFREKLRGYHPEDVDGFLEEVAAALDGLLARLQAVEAPASSTPSAPASGSPVAPVTAVAPSSGLHEGMVAQALLVAQYTADRSIAEAEDLARMMHAQARADAVRLVVDAEAALQSGADEAHRAAEAAVRDLEQQRASLERDVAALRSWVVGQRDKLSGALSAEPPWVYGPPAEAIVDLVALEPVVDLTPAASRPT